METKLLIKETAVKEFEVAFVNAKKHDINAELNLEWFDREYYVATIRFYETQFLYWLGRYNQLAIDLNKLELD